MLETTLGRLACPGLTSPCDGRLNLEIEHSSFLSACKHEDVASGSLICRECGACYPIIAGIAIVVADWKEYVLSRWEFISKLPRERIPAFVASVIEDTENQGKRYAPQQEWESDDILNAYLLNHFMCYSLNEFDDLKEIFTAPRIFDLIAENWPQTSPFQMKRWLEASPPCQDFLELGCSVGGTVTLLPDLLKGSYLGIDLSMRSIAVARKLLLETDAESDGLLPHGKCLDTEMWIDPGMREKIAGMDVDFIVGSAWQPPVSYGAWSFVSAANILDFSSDPQSFAIMQNALLTKEGRCFLTAPISPFSPIANKMGSGSPDGDLTNKLISLYRRAGFELLDRRDDLPWIIPRGPRYIEYFSVDAFLFAKHSEFGSS